MHPSPVVTFYWVGYWANVAAREHSDESLQMFKEYAERASVAAGIVSGLESSIHSGVVEQKAMKQLRAAIEAYLQEKYRY